MLKTMLCGLAALGFSLAPASALTGQPVLDVASPITLAQGGKQDTAKDARKAAPAAPAAAGAAKDAKAPAAATPAAAPSKSGDY